MRLVEVPDITAGTGQGLVWKLQGGNVDPRSLVCQPRTTGAKTPQSSYHPDPFPFSYPFSFWLFLLISLASMLAVPFQNPQYCFLSL